MEYTQNYQLPLWDKEDAVKRTDFNENNQKIDAAIAAVAASVSDLIVTGTYTGTANTGAGGTAAQETQTIDLGFQPRFLFVRDTSYRGSSTVSDNWTPQHLGFATPQHPHYIYAQYTVLRITETGFVAGGANGFFNTKGNVYAYLAIR